MDSEVKSARMREVRAGLTTSVTASYIIVVNPQILAATGMDKAALVTATCLAAAFGTGLLALFVRVPFMMAPGMGLNSFFAFSLCLGQSVPWQTALGVVFLSGSLFLLLSLLGLREKLVEGIPQGLRHATAVGIGIFLAFIGLQNLGIIVKNEATLVGLGTVNTSVQLGIIGFFLSTLLLVKRVKGALLLGILATTLLAVVFKQIPLPDSLVALPPDPTPLLFQLNIVEALSLSLLPVVFTFMYVDMFDSIGTLVGLCDRTGIIDKQGKIDRLGGMLTCDAVASMAGALFGTSTTTVYIESASGVTEGGRGALTAWTIAVLFLLALFLSPLVIAIPPYAVAPAIILVGFYMLADVKKIPFDSFEEGVPAFLTVIMMPLTYSIANGITMGFASYVIIQILLGRLLKINRITLLIGVLSLLNLFFLR